MRKLWLTNKIEDNLPDQFKDEQSPVTSLDILELAYNLGKFSIKYLHVSWKSKRDCQTFQSVAIPARLNERLGLYY